MKIDFAHINSSGKLTIHNYLTFFVNFYLTISAKIMNKRSNWSRHVVICPRKYNHILTSLIETVYFIPKIGLGPMISSENVLGTHLT